MSTTVQTHLPCTSSSPSKSSRKCTAIGAIVVTRSLAQMPVTAAEGGTTTTSSPRVMNVTANVGTLFENLSTHEQPWLAAVKERLVHERPSFVAVHMQEVGGKIAGPLMKKNTPTFMSNLCTTMQSVGMTHGVIYVDPHVDALDKFTALSSCYFSTAAITQFYDYSTHEWTSMSPLTIRDSALLRVTFGESPPSSSVVEKSRFSTEHAGRTSFRKGYTLASVRFANGRVVDFVNIHLFHDESNIVAVVQTMSSPCQPCSPPLGLLLSPSHNNVRSPQKSISSYARRRQRAMIFAHKECLTRISQRMERWPDTSDSLLFIFGDFNVRLNAGKLVDRLIKMESSSVTLRQSGGVTTPLGNNKDSRSSSDSEPPPPTSFAALIADSVCTSDVEGCNPVSPHHTPITSLHLQDDVLSIKAKKFDYRGGDGHSAWVNTSCAQWRDIDTEIDDMCDQLHLHELNVTFKPTYPLCEQLSSCDGYNTTRVPAWCDRVIMNTRARSTMSRTTYDVAGRDVCTGDHKPVYLCANI